MKFSTTFTLAALMSMSSGTDARISGNQRELHSHHHSHDHDHGHTPSTDHNKSSGYEVYGVNTCGYGVNPYNKTDIDVHFYLADDDIVQANLRKGECYHFGQTTKEQPEYSTEGEGIDIQPTKWPDAFMCKDLGKEAGEMIQQELNLCVGVEFPENACVVDVC